jgi:hypothetical protein
MHTKFYSKYHAGRDLGVDGWTIMERDIKKFVT